MVTYTEDQVLDVSVMSDETGQGIKTAIEALASATANSPTQLDYAYSQMIVPGKIDQLFEQWYAIANDGNFTKTELLARWFKLMKDDKIYGVKTYNFASSQSTDGSLTDDSVALGVCTPATEASPGVDNFVKQPAFWIKEINYEIDANGEIDVKAIQGVDEEYSRLGTQGMVGVAQKSGFYMEYNDGTYTVMKYSTTRLSGYKALPECVSPVDNSVRPFMVHAKYMAGLDSNSKPTSATGLAPLIYLYSHNSQDTAWKTRGNNYAGISGCDLTFREKMFRLKYAKKGNSGTMEGCSGYNYEYRPAIGESNVKRVVLTTAQAANILVGSWLSVGASGSRNSNNVLKAVKVLSKTVVSDSYTAINLDTDTAISPTTDWYVSTIPWGSGSCDDVKGVDGSPNLTNGKYPFIIQGLESQIGAYAVAADIISTRALSDNTMTFTANMVRLAAKISTSVTADYHVEASFQFTNSTAANWQYIQDLQEGKDLPIPKGIGGAAGSSNGCKAGFYDPHSNGTFEWLAWAGLDFGGLCGLAAVSTYNGLASTGWNFAAGAPGSAANRGEWQA